MLKNTGNSFIIPFLTFYIIIICFFIIPFRVIEQGYLPSDDALRHAAKVISGKDWNEILVLSDKIKTDTHPGWHSILGLVQKITHSDQISLVIFSVAALFFIFCFIPVFFLELPQAWLMALFTISLVNDSFIVRLFSGRPYLFTMSVLLVLSFLWPKLRDNKSPYRILCFITLLIALSVWIHGSWYLFILPIICFFLAGERKAGILISIASVIGILLGAIFTGHPYLFLRQNIAQVLLVFGNNTPQRNLALEFQPFTGDILTVMIISGILFWLYASGRWDVKKIKNPLFILAVLGWFLGFLSKRLWWDWGMPALCVWMALEFQEIFKRFFGKLSISRVIVVMVLAAAIYSVFTSDVHYRWRDRAAATSLDYNKPEHKKLLPEAGGIIYSDDMTVFYQTFFRNPHAPWRYILGFEPSWMPPEDLKIFRNIQKSFFSDSSYAPWVNKMKPQDRLIVRMAKYEPPEISGLEWSYVPNMVWIGRLPRPSVSPSIKQQ
jgi:hypothetical protein